MAADRQFAFGAFRFDVRTGQLWRDGSEVKLTPRAAAVLQMLIERAPEVVTKQELFDDVWGGATVGDDALTSCIHELRVAIGDDARYPRTIETRHRRGYRFMMPASPIDRAPPTLQVSAREPSQFVGLRRREIRWNLGLRAIQQVFILVIVEFTRWQDLAGQGSLRLFVAEHRTLQFAANNAALDDDLPVVLCG